MLKRILCFLLIFTVIFTAVPFGRANAANSTVDTLISLVKRFPQGEYWNHVGKANDPDGITSTPCENHADCDWVENSCNCNSFDNAIQCMGYAHKISYEITGVMPRNNYEKFTTLKASELRVGDIIRYRWNGHSICVTGVKGNKISFTDCNYIGRCQIRWDVMDISDIIGFSYVLRLKGNQRKNSDLTFYESVSDTKVEANTVNYETWQMSDNVLNIRSTRKTSANVIGKIPPNATFNIYDKYYDGTYIWGKVVYGEVMGWCALNYSEYISGVIERPTIKNSSALYTAGEPINFQWREVGGATKYVIRVYNSSGKLVKKHTVGRKIFEKAITISTAGKYTAKVVAGSSLIPSWEIESKTYSFSVADAGDMVFAESVNFTAPETIIIGKSSTLKPTVKPSSATEKAVTWKSSDSSIATVDSSGVLTAKNFGEVTITCTAADKGEVSRSRKITVIPEKVKNVSQSNSTSTSVTLKWSKVSGASSYIISKYNSKTDTYEKIGTSETNSYVMTTSPSKTYKIKVRAIVKVASKTCYGYMSDEFKAVSGPKAPTLSAKVGDKKVTLSWDAVSGATQYVIYQIKNGEKIKIATENVDTTNYSYTVKNLKSGTYTYAIRAIKQVGDQKGYGSYSKTVKVTVK